MTDRPQRNSIRRRTVWLLIGVLAVALGLRVVAWVRFPVVHDEVRVMAFGLARALVLENGDLAFETPVTVSNGITPLWFWLQAIPAAIFGVISKAGLRLLPLALGLAGTALAFQAGRKLYNERTAWFSGLVYATMSLMLYTNGRGEFTESLIAPALLALLLDLAPRKDHRPVPLRAALWPALALLVYLGKGLPIWMAYSGALGLLWLLGHVSRAAHPRLSLFRLVALIGLPVVPALLWLVAAEASLFGSGRSMITDLGAQDSIWPAIWKLTAGYGTEVKEFMVANGWDALYPFTDFAAWPTLSTLAVPTLAALIGLGLQLVLGLRARTPDPVERALVPLALGVPLLAMLLVKGALGARFHLLYLPVLLPHAARVVDAWLALLEKGRTRWFLAGGAAAWVYVAFTASWLNRTEATLVWSRWAWLSAAGLGTIGLLALLGRRKTWRQTAALSAALLVSAFLVASSLTHGSLDWGRRWAWEPGPIPGQVPHRVDAYPGADAQLTEYALERELGWRLHQARRADGSPPDRRTYFQQKYATSLHCRPLLLQSVKQHPDDRACLLAFGTELFHVSPEDRPFMGPLLMQCLERYPDDRQVLLGMGTALFAFSPADRPHVLHLFENYLRIHPHDPDVGRALRQMRGER